MGEVVLSAEKGAESETQKQKEKVEVEESGTESKGGDLNGLMRWEKFLPRMILRVLLVEADDSTRQIIAALLRKCSYKVAAVPDGLKAWEILKGRPHNIDLILTEVDLPSVSGYALLTLIMEHEICKSIPVIMMSSQDSVSTVYKCMLRGAADYLVKPLRKNELRNLWQHVWRRQSSTVSGNGPQDESFAQQKVEATAENNAASNRTSGDAACIQRNKELIEKGSDAQSSCTKHDLEAESNVQEYSQLKDGESYPSETKMQEVETRIHLGQTSTPCGKDGDPDHHRSASTSGNFDCSPQLDLSLRRSHPAEFENAVAEESHILIHSNASAFKRYTNRQLQAPPAAFINFCDQQREQRDNFERVISNTGTGNNSDSSTPGMQRSIMSPATAQSKESELATSHTQQGLSRPILVKGIRFNDLCTAYGSVLPPMFCKQSGPPSMPNPRSVAHLESTCQVNGFYQSNVKENTSDQPSESRDQNANNATNQTVYMQEHKLEHVEDQGLISPTTDQSANSSFCNGNVSHLNSIGYGSNCGSKSNVDQVAIVRAASESKNEDLANNGSSHRSIQREAALNKFRLKRKERCYEKKVRYESRKKLAEQRPRVKGQFVRQVHPDLRAPEKDG